MNKNCWQLCWFFMFFISTGVNAGLLFSYSAENLPSQDEWEIVDYFDNYVPAYEQQVSSIENRTLHISDQSTSNGSYITYQKGWNISPDLTNVVEFDIKIVSSSDTQGIYFGINLENEHMLYGIRSDRIESFYSGVDGGYTKGDSYIFNTTSQTNTYKALIQEGVAKLYINGDLVINQPAGTGKYFAYSYAGVQFGSGSSVATGEAYIFGIRAYTTPISSATTPTSSAAEYLTSGKLIIPQVSVLDAFGIPHIYYIEMIQRPSTFTFDVDFETLRLLQ